MAERLFKRGRIWYALVREHTGRWVKVSTRCTDKVAAEAHRRRLERQLADPAAAAEAEATLESILSDYLRSRVSRERAAGSVQHVRQKSNALVTHLPAMASELSHAKCELYIELRREDGVRNTTIKKELRVLQAALRHARKNGRFLRDPETIIPDLEDDYRPRERFLTPWELVSLCSTLPTGRAAHVAWIVATGARWSESVRACRGDVGPDLVHLHGSKTKLARQGRKVPITALTRSILAWSLDRAGGDLLFDRWSNVRRDLLEACTAVGILPASPNDLRRTFSTWHRQAGVETSLLASMLGHTTSRMVERVYGRLDPAAAHALLAERLPAGQHLGLLPVHTWPEVVTLAAETPVIPVPRPRVELGTRGFSIPAWWAAHSTKARISRNDGQHMGIEWSCPAGMIQGSVTVG